MMIIAFILVGALVYYTFNTNSSNNNNHSNNNNSQNNPSNLGTANNPLDILNERFAKGEIEEAEYLKKKAILNQ